MSYQVLARKWRPLDFSSTVGQDHVVRALTHALTEKRLHHAYLFTGTRGVGKTTLARILAKALNCTGHDGSGDITATPCGVCESCVAITAGRYVDYIEMDAASNRGVEEMTALLERAMYAPSSARFKVYMIDEVHMLSNHAFNAMLKTLEEPPEYVKFILATTDPQKLPVTVLSRCLQFNLKQMTPPAIAGQMTSILAQEGVAAEPAALRMLAHAARGSMRDGLSLLDQAIAYSAGDVTLEAVRGMLGAIDHDTLTRLLDALATRDARQMLAIADEMASRSLSFGQALRDFASLLHRIALAQQVPQSVQDDEPDAAEVRRFAAAMTPEDVQLAYQIALHGRNDLHLAPDEYAGFTMALMRMLAFAPADAQAAVPRAQSAALLAQRPVKAAVSLPLRTAPVVPLRSSTEVPPLRSKQSAAAPALMARPLEKYSSDALLPNRLHASEPVDSACPPPFDGDWPALVARLKVSGLVRELAQQSELVSANADHFTLRVPIKTLLDAGALEKLKAAMAAYFGRPMRVSADVGATRGPTVAGITQQARAERQRQAEEAIYADPVVRELIDNFGAAVDPASIRPRDA